MRTCRKCNERIPHSVKVDGKKHFLSNRVFCLSCSPFGSRNTSSIDPDRKCRNPRKQRWATYTPEQKQRYMDRCQERRTLRKKQFIELKGGCCQHCGYNKSINALSFHHRDPSTKEFGLDQRTIAAYTMERLLKELNKCDLLCLNCHMELHYG